MRRIVEGEDVGTLITQTPEDVLKEETIAQEDSV